MIPRMNFEAILFDCDGVLVDSEAITCGVLRDMFEEQGWRMTLAECMQRFVMPVARLLHAAQRHGVVGPAIGVDVDNARADGAHHAMGAAEV